MQNEQRQKKIFLSEKNPGNKENHFVVNDCHKSCCQYVGKEPIRFFWLKKSSCNVIKTSLTQFSERHGSIHFYNLIKSFKEFHI